MSIDDLIGEDDDDGNGDGLGSTFYQTPIDTQTIVVNPKVDGGPVDLRCPHCDEVIEAVSGEHVVGFAAVAFLFGRYLEQQRRDE